MTPRKKRGVQKPPQSKAEAMPFTFSNPHIQQTAAHAAWTHQAQSAAHIAAEMGSMFGGSRAAWLEYQVPASETKEGLERERAYYEALGRFVQMFAEVEKVITQTLWAYAGTKAEVAKIVFAGTQSETAAGYIKAVAKATNASDESLADLENVLQQFGIIRGARNDILHYGAKFIAEGKGLVSNAWKAKAEPTEFPISADALLHMETDLRKIIAHLGYRHLGRARPKSAFGQKILDDTLHFPWRYKHPSPLKSETKKREPTP
jgi:hypothetical protein